MAQLGDKCANCTTILTEFTGSFVGPSLLRVCKECRRIDKSNSYHKHSHKRIKKVYGLEKTEFEKLREIHLNGCAICKQPKVLAIDHNHDTNETRGLLCHNCNLALGLLKEDEELIWNMLEYVKKYSRRVVNG